VQKDLAVRISERQALVKEIAVELERLEAQRRGLRERRKDVESKQRALEKSAADRESGPDASAASRESAAALRREARKLDDERADIDGRLAGLEKPIADASARHQQAKQELDAGKKDLANAKEGHRHKQTELDAETARRYKELQSAEAEIARRLVTLGTIVNLNRPPRSPGPGDDRADFGPLFERADELRALISARETEIERLEAERDAFDRASLVRGVAVLVGTMFALLLVFFVVRAL
jgi:DNA repair exonuclease SbcCD ATPase subunit